MGEHGFGAGAPAEFGGGCRKLKTRSRFAIAGDWRGLSQLAVCHSVLERQRTGAPFCVGALFGAPMSHCWHRGGGGGKRHNSGGALF